jgi:outer membrane immunogenic protein
MKKIAIAVVALCFATPALAQDAPSISGPWVAAEEGWDHVDLNEGSAIGSKNGLVYGGSLGYDQDYGKVVLGIEGEVTGSNVTAAVNDGLGNTADLKLGRDFYAGARLGFKVGPKTMFYGKVGYTNQRVDANYTLDGTTAAVSGHLDGYRLGAGVQYTEGHMFGRLEYRYSDYGTWLYQGVPTGLSTGRHQIAVLAGYRF